MVSLSGGAYVTTSDSVVSFPVCAGARSTEPTKGHVSKLPRLIQLRLPQHKRARALIKGKIIQRQPLPAGKPERKLRTLVRRERDLAGGPNAPMVETRKRHVAARGLPEDPVDADAPILPWENVVGCQVRVGARGPLCKGEPAVEPHAGIGCDGEELLDLGRAVEIEEVALPGAGQRRDGLAGGERLARGIFYKGVVLLVVAGNGGERRAGFDAVRVVCHWYHLPRLAAGVPGGFLDVILLVLEVHAVVLRAV